MTGRLGAIGVLLVSGRMLGTAAKTTRVPTEQPSHCRRRSRASPRQRDCRRRHGQLGRRRHRRNACGFRPMVTTMLLAGLGRRGHCWLGRRSRRDRHSTWLWLGWGKPGGVERGRACWRQWDVLAAVRLQCVPSWRRHGWCAAGQGRWVFVAGQAAGCGRAAFGCFGGIDGAFGMDRYRRHLCSCLGCGGCCGCCEKNPRVAKSHAAERRGGTLMVYSS